MAWKNEAMAQEFMEAHDLQEELMGSMKMSLDELGALYQLMLSLPCWAKAHQQQNPSHYSGKDGEKMLEYHSYQMGLLKKLLKMGLDSCYQQWEALPDGEQKELLSYPPNGEFLFCGNLFDEEE